MATKPKPADAPSALLQEMVVFARVVEQGSLSAAARSLGQTSSAVSRSVARLEAYMGVQLLHRNSRSLSTTDFGEQMYVGCAQIARTALDLHSLAGAQAMEPSGKLRLTAPVGLGQRWLVPRLQPLLQRWPQLHLSITLTDRIVDVVEENFDLALRIGTELPPGLVARPLLRTRYVLVANGAYLARRGVPAHAGELIKHACVVLGYSEFTGCLSLRHVPSGERVQAQTSGPIDVNNGGAILSAVQAGIGIGVLPDFTAHEALNLGHVIRVLPDWELLSPYQDRPVHALYSPTRHLARKVRVLIDWLVALES